MFWNIFLNLRKGAGKFSSVLSKMKAGTLTSGDFWQGLTDHYKKWFTESLSRSEVPFSQRRGRRAFRKLFKKTGELAEGDCWWREVRAQLLLNTSIASSLLLDKRGAFFSSRDESTNVTIRSITPKGKLLGQLRRIYGARRESQSRAWFVKKFITFEFNVLRIDDLLHVVLFWIKNI